MATARAAPLASTLPGQLPLPHPHADSAPEISPPRVPPATRLEITFDLKDGALQISARGDSPLGKKTPFLTSWAKTILDEVTDQIEVRDVEGAAHATFSVERG